MGDDELAEVVKRAIQAHGVHPVRRALGISAEATCRIGGGLRTQPGTRALAAANLPRLATLETDRG